MRDLTKISIDTDSLLDAFNIVPSQGKPCVELDKWLAATGILTPLQSALLDDVYERYHDFINGWNEEELKMKMISFLFHIADIEERGKIATFFERPLKATIDNYKLSVICDCLVATPKVCQRLNFLIFFFKNLKKGKATHTTPKPKCWRQYLSLNKLIMMEKQYMDHGLWVVIGNLRL
jgi:hypothetical protein